jgi:hypothetical protein
MAITQSLTGRVGGGEAAALASGGVDEGKEGKGDGENTVGALSKAMALLEFSDELMSSQGEGGGKG